MVETSLNRCSPQRKGLERHEWERDDVGSGATDKKNGSLCDGALAPGTSGEASPAVVSSRSESPAPRSMMGSSPDLARSLLKHHPHELGGLRDADERENLLPGWQNSSLALPDQSVSHGARVRPPHPIPPWERTYMVFIFTLSVSLLSADQNLLAPALSPIAEEFGFNDVEKDKYLGGYISAVFFAVGAPAAFVIGYLSHRMNRKDLLFLVILLGEGPCLATYWVRKYWQLLLLRTLTGIAVGGVTPLVFSLIGDLFYVDQRSTASAAVQIAVGLGLAMGTGVAGAVGPVWGWRWPFVLVAIPAVACATIMLFTTREPPRGCTEEALQERYGEGNFQYEEAITWRKISALLRIPSNLCVTLQGLPGCLPWGVLLTFFIDFFHEEKGASIHFGTLLVMVCGLGGAVGVLGGGWLGQLLHNRSPTLMPLFAGATVAAAAFPTWYLINAPLPRTAAMYSALYVSTFLSGVLSGTPGPNARAVLIDVNEPETRGVALAMMTVLDDLGKGAGPFLVAQFIAAWGRLAAFNFAIGGWLLCGFSFGCAALFLARDEAAMQERLRERAGSAYRGDPESGGSTGAEGAPSSEAAPGYPQPEAELALLTGRPAHESSTPL
eukprot:jgi/Botrbrau1/11090/Bobra.0219s0002.2